MKRRIATLSCILAFLLIAGTVLPSCKKYEDGPLFSFKSRDARVTNNWVAELISRNEIDITKRYEYMHLDFRGGGDFEWKAKLIDDASDSTFTARWELATLDQQIKIDYADPVTFEPRLLYFNIRRMTSKELWLDYIWKGDNYALRLIPR